MVSWTERLRALRSSGKSCQDSSENSVSNTVGSSGAGESSSWDSWEADEDRLLTDYRSGQKDSTSISGRVANDNSTRSATHEYEAIYEKEPDTDFDGPLLPEPPRRPSEQSRRVPSSHKLKGQMASGRISVERRPSQDGPASVEVLRQSQTGSQRKDSR